MTLNARTQNRQTLFDSREKRLRKGFGKQVPLAEKAKVFEIIQFRELGKLASYLRYMTCLLSDGQVAVTRSIGLFNKPEE